LAREVLLALAERLEADADGQACWNAVRKELESISGAKGKALFQPIRVALTGRGHGRELDRLWPLIQEGSHTLPGVVPSARSRVDSTLEKLR
jgi:glutamyl/glutaminyl-tRNA synthetase